MIFSIDYELENLKYHSGLIMSTVVYYDGEDFETIKIEALKKFPGCTVIDAGFYDEACGIKFAKIVLPQACNII